MNKHQNAVQDCPRCGVACIHYGSSLYQPTTQRLLSGNPFNYTSQPADLDVRNVYVEHACDEQVVQAHELRKDQALQALQDFIEKHPARYSSELYSQMQQARDENREAQQRLRQSVYDLGLAFTCKTCDAVIGEPCWNLSERKRGNRRHTKHPHDARMPQLEFETNPVLLEANQEVSRTGELYAEIYEQLNNYTAPEPLTTLVAELIKRLR